MLMFGNEYTAGQLKTTGCSYPNVINNSIQNKAVHYNAYQMHKGAE